jgi:prepilin-type N-terminal cleavage/methylation domain-containing protein
MTMHRRSRDEGGFSLIEMIVSLGIFSVIVTTAIGALLVLIATNQRLQGEQSVMTNLSYALDSMTRDIRTGYNYYCDSAYSAETAGGPENIFSVDNSQEAVIGTDTQDCDSIRNNGHQVHGLSFFEGGNSIVGTTGENRILYYYDASALTIMRRVGDGVPQSIISSGLEITDAEFIVTGSDPESSGDIVQPTVTISVEAREIGEEKVYRLQTTVTQRVLDL